MGFCGGIAEIVRLCVRRASDRHMRMDDSLFADPCGVGCRKRVTAATRKDQLKPRFRGVTWRSPDDAGSGFVASNGYPARSLVHAHMPVACAPRA